MKILILGGRGFVGHNLKNYLSNFYLVETASRKRDETNQYFDINDSESYSICENNYDVIINCIVNYENSVHDTIKNELNTKLEFINFINKTKVHYIEISSISAINENKYLSVYNFNKFLLEEMILFVANKQPSFEFSIIRFAQIIDEEEIARKTQGAFYYFVDSFKNNTILNVFGDPNKQRSYMPISYLVEVIKKCIDEKVLGVHNVVMPDRYSAQDLINFFNKYVQKSEDSILYDQTKFAFEYVIPPCSEYFINQLSSSNCETTFKKILLNEKV